MPSTPPDTSSPRSEDEKELKEFLRETGKRLSQARHAAGLTRRQVSELTGVAQGSIYMIEGGGTNAGIEILWRLTKALGLTLGELFGSAPGEAGTGATLRRLANFLDQMTTNYREQVKRQAAHREYTAAMEEAMVSYLRVLEEARARLLSSRGGVDDE
jgi:transcriptional regulator with XRE-family HTH domain